MLRIMLCLRKVDECLLNIYLKAGCISSADRQEQASVTWGFEHKCLESNLQPARSHICETPCTVAHTATLSKSYCSSEDVLVLKLWSSVDETSSTDLLLSSVTELVMMSKTRWSKKIYIFAGFAFQTLNLTNPHTFRDLSKPMGAQTVERKRKFIQRYNEVEKSEGECFRRLIDRRGLSPLRPLGMLLSPLKKSHPKTFQSCG